MKIAAWVIAVLGIVNFFALPVGFFRPPVTSWPLLIAASILGAFLILIAIGIWKRNIAAWRFGFLAIALCAIYSLVSTWPRLPAGSASGKAIFMIASLVGIILVAANWSVVWYRQKKWFEPDQNRLLR